MHSCEHKEIPALCKKPPWRIVINTPSISLDEQACNLFEHSTPTFRFYNFQDTNGKEHSHHIQLTRHQLKMCFDIMTYTLGCSCRCFQGDKVIAIRTQGCKYAASNSSKPNEICDPLLNGRPREVIPSMSREVSCTVHNMLTKRGDDPNAVTPYVHKDLAAFIEVKAYVNNDAYRDFRRMAEMELKTKNMLDRYIKACQAINPRTALEKLEEDLDFEVSTVEEPRCIIKAAVPGFLESAGK